MKRFKLALLLIFPALLAAFFLRNLIFKQSMAAWFNDSWGYRKSVQISNSSGSNLTDFQVNIGIGTSALISSGKMKSDCSDIRITDTNGKLLNHWIEENNPGCNKPTDTKVWVKVPSLPTSGGTVYVYYGNPSATNVGDGNKVFEFFDDFNQSSINTSRFGTFVAGSGTVAIDSSTFFSGNSVRVNMRSTPYTNKAAGLYTLNTFSLPITVEYWMRKEDGTYGVYLGMSTGTTASKVFDTTGQIGAHNTYGSNIHKFIGIGTSGSVVGANQTWYKYVVNLNSTSQTTKVYNTSDTLLDTINTSVSAGSTTNLLLSWGASFDYWNRLDTYNQDRAVINVDSVVVRKSASADPTSSLSSTEEQSKAPVAYWKFDEGTGTVAKDSTSNGNNGIFGAGAAAPTWQTEDMCVSGKCLNFNGSNDYVSVSDSSRFDLLNLTLSAWIKINNTASSSRRIVSQQDGSNYWLLHISDNKLTAWFSLDGVGGVSKGPALNDGKWHHIALTRDTINDSVTWWIDGISIGSQATSNNSTYQINNSVFIGAYNGSSQFFPGFIDEVKIYPYARSAAEIKTDYNTGKGKAGTAKGVAVHLGGGGDSSEVGGFSQGLVGYWNFDVGTGTSAPDLSGNANTANFGTGNSAPGWVAGNYGIGVSFDGNDYATSSSDPGTMSSGTYSLWVKPSSINSMYGWIDNSFDIFQWVGSIVYFRAGNQSSVSISSWSANTWHHVAMTWNGTNYYGYLDGQQVTSGTQSGSRTGVINMGRVDGGYNYSGSLDDVRIYNRALSPAEVRQLYNWAPGPIGYWSFDDGSGLSVADKSGNGNTGTWSGTGSHWTTGKFGKAGNFNGSNDRVQTSAGVSGITSDFTYSVWIYPTQNTGGNALGILGNLDYAPTGYGCTLSQRGQYIYVQWGAGGALYSWANKITNINTWYHLVLTHKADVFYLYINGVLQAGTPTQTVNQNNTKVTIGRWDQDYNDYYFQGLIDDARVYNYARTSKQIVEDMNAGHPAVGSPVGSAVAHYEFDEGYGTVVNNSGNASSAINGTWNGSNSHWSNSGKFGKAGIFNGNADYVDAGNGAGVKITGPFTLSVWVSPNNSGNDIQGLITKDTAYNLWYHNGFSSLQGFSASINGTSSTKRVSFVDDTTGWKYITVSFDGSTLKLYKDGVLKSSASASNPSDNNYSLRIGMEDYNGGNNPADYRGFNGLIDEVKIYNYSLTEDEIKLDMNQGKALVLGALSNNSSYEKNAANQEYCVPGDTTSCAAPVARWDFEEGRGTSVIDSSGNGKNSTSWHGSSTNHYTTGKFGKALIVNGTDDYAMFGDLGIPQNGPATVEGWVNFDKNAIEKGNWEGFFTPLYQHSSNNYIYFSGGGSDYFQVANYIKKKTWQYIALTYSGDTSTAKLYIDGIQYLATQPGGPDNIPALSSFVMGITDGFFGGKLDNVRVFNYARSPAQIAWDYNQGGPVAWYKMDECSGTTIHSSNDPYNSSLNGTLTVGANGTQSTVGTCSSGIGTTAAWGNGSVGKYNASLNFDGTDDYMSVADNINLQVEGGNFTVSVWVKPTIVQQQAILFKANPNMTNAGYSLIMNRLGSDISLTKNGVIDQAVSYIFQANTWYHITAVQPLNGNVTYYINGQSIGSYSNTSSYQSSSGRAFYIGDADTYFGNKYSGQIDDVKIFNYALTATQIKNEYNQGSAVRFGPVTGSP